MQFGTFRTLTASMLRSSLVHSEGRAMKITCQAAAGIMPLVVIFAAPGLAHAAVVVPPSYSVEAEVVGAYSQNGSTALYNPGPNSVGEVGSARLGGGLANGYALAGPFGGGAVLASVWFGPSTVTLTSGSISEDVESSVNYTIQVNGPSGYVVPLHIDAILSAAKVTATDLSGHPIQVVDYGGGQFGLATDTGFYRVGASAGIQIAQYYYNTSIFQYVQYSGGTWGVDSTLNTVINGNSFPTYDIKAKGVELDQIINVLPNTDINVSLYANALLDYSFGGDDPQYATTSAEVDPVFTIADPVLASLYTINGVPEAVAPVPEPATWAMMICGFGLVGTLARRRRNLEQRRCQIQTVWST
jgi:hypothetical protein